MDVLAALRQVELFAALDEPALLQIAALVRRRTFDRGELLFAEGDPFDALLVLVSGAVTLSRTSHDGARATVSLLERPAGLEEIALLDAVRRTATAEATEPTTVLSLSRQDFFGLLVEQPALLEPLVRQLGAMVRRLTEQAADHVSLDLAGRVAKSLIRLAGVTSPPVVAITQGRLAEISGGSRQSVNRVLSGFAQRGLVHVEGRRVLLTDVPGLRRRAHLPPETAPRKASARRPARRSS